MRLAAVLLTLVLCAPAAAETAFPEIDRAQAALETAADALKAARSGRARLAALGKAVSAHEAALAAYRTGLRNMTGRAAQLGRDMTADRAQLEKLTAALQSLSQAPRSALMAFPGGPVGAARGAALMSEIMPLINDRIALLEQRLETLAILRASQDAARVEAKGALASLQDLRAQTAEAIRARRSRDLPARAELSAQAEAAMKQAQSIGDLTASLAGAEIPDTGALVSFSEARGLISPPVQGTVTAAFGDKDPWGRAGQGLTFTAPSYSQVTAPWDGTVRYAGPLIDYGQVVVLEPEDGTLIVLAGLAVVDRVVGETVLTGERLGDLGGALPASDEFLLEATTDRDEIGVEKLYMELRRDGQAVDPADWFDLTQKG